MYAATYPQEHHFLGDEARAHRGRPNVDVPSTSSPDMHGATKIGISADNLLYYRIFFYEQRPDEAS